MLTFQRILGTSISSGELKRIVLIDIGRLDIPLEISEISEISEMLNSLNLLKS